jgi:putative Mg2+ transporter-C (MgtC) family protein
VTLAHWDLALRLALAGAFGALVGFERESRNHPAGMRTHALVGLGACLFTVAGAYGFADVDKGPNVDPARVAAQVATGIGFIGAGAIMRNGFNVRGLTTAATLWLVAALGVAVGAGSYVTAAVGFAVVLAVLIGLRFVKTRVGGTPRLLVVEYRKGHGTLGHILDQLERGNGGLGHLQLEDGDTTRRALIEVAEADLDDLEGVMSSIGARREVLDVHLQEGVVPGGVTVGAASNGNAARRL